MNREFDLIIVGGGINGATIFYKASSAGIKTLLVEMDDFACGTTGRCGGMLHGGLRYLDHDYITTRLTSRDSGIILNLAKFLPFRIPFIYPFLGYEKIPIDVAELGLTTYDRYAKYKGGITHLRLSASEVLKLEPRLSSDIKGALTFDEWGVDPFRLTSIFIESGVRAGGTAFNHTPLINFLTKNGNVTGIICKSVLNNEELNFHGKLVILAAGPWNPSILKKLNIDLRLRPTKGIHLVFPGRISPFGFIFTAIDGRSIYLIPHKTNTILGCTDDDYFGDIDNIEITRDEVEYLIDGASRYFNRIKNYKILRAFAGVRPTLMEMGKYEDDLSRDYLIADHEKRDRISGIISISGGKFAGSLSAADECMKVALKKIKKGVDKRNLSPLLGGSGDIKTENLSYIQQKRFGKYGSQMREIDDQNDDILCLCEMISQNEILHVIKNESVKSLDDLRRRTRFSMGACQGGRCIERVFEFAKSILDLNLDERNKYIKKRLSGILSVKHRGSIRNENRLVLGQF